MAKILMIDKNNIYVFCRLFFSMILLFPCYVSATEVTKESIKNRQNVSIITMEVFPYGYISKSGEPSGIWYEILNKILLKSGIDKITEIIPTKRLARYIDKEEPMCTLIADDGPNIDKTDLLEPIGQILSAGILPKKGIKIEEYSDLRDLIIAVPLGIEFNNNFDNDSTIQKTHPLHYLNAIKMLSKGRVDGIAGAIPILKYIAKSQGISQAEFDNPYVFLTVDVYLMCTFSVKQTIRNKLRKALLSLKKEGKIKRILTGAFLSSPQ